MSRRKVRALTRTGRQVSEDPDIDNLLSNLSPEEMEELEKEVLTVPDPDPEADVLVGLRKRNQIERQPSLNNNREAKLDNCGRETKNLTQRQPSYEGEPKKESRKQQYLRKMGLSQERSFSRSESQEGEMKRQDSVSTEREHKWEDRNCKDGEDLKLDRAGPSNRFRREESRDMERNNEGKEKDRNEESKLKEKKEEIKKKEESNSKMKELISKLQEKKEDSKEKERKEDSRKREDSKTKELISKLQEKKEKEDRKTRGIVSKLEERQSQVRENQTDERRSRGLDKGQSTLQLEKIGPKQKEKEVVDDVKEESLMKKEKDQSKVKEKEKENVKEKEESERKKEKEQGKVKEKEESERKKEKEQGKVKEKERENVKEKEESERKKEKEQGKVKEKERENVKEKGKEKDKVPGETLKLSKSEESGNSMANKSPGSKTKEEEEEEDEASSMFDELVEKVSSNDPQLIELNVNNSEVIKIKTLIQFAEVLQDNTHVKAFALANTRADDHVAYAIAGTLRSNKTITSINLDSNHLTSKGITALIYALQHNSTLTELRFHNQRHICGGKTEMEMAKVLKDNTTLLKLGYHFELAGPRMTMTNILSRNMDRQRQRRLQEQKQAQANGEKKGTLEVPKATGSFPKGSPKVSPFVSPQPSPQLSPKVTPKKAERGIKHPPPPPPPPPAPVLDMNCLRNSLTPVSQRKLDNGGSGSAGGKNSRDQLLASIRKSNIKLLKKVEVPKLLQ